MAKEDFVPVAGDDWYQRRRQDAEGEFLKKVTDQGPRKESHTKQGIYCLTADGKLLAYRPGDQQPGQVKAALKRGLDEWKKLPEDQRKPGAVDVPDLEEPDKKYTRTMPENALIVNVFARILEKDSDGVLQCGKASVPGGNAASRDHVWLKEDEWKALIPDQPKAGAEVPLPEHVVNRILRFHLVDNTRGEPSFWKKEEIRSQSLKLTIDSVDEDAIQMKLEGSVQLSTESAESDKARGYDARLLGHIRVDRKARRIDRFDIVAVGDHWGEGTYTRGARPGRTPLGIAFELARGDSPADRAPPQGARDIGGYLAR
jgi:hypothetical protein